MWEPPLRFVDEQTRGPYRRWRHEHVFEEVDGGTLCRDIVDYEVYGGSLIDALLVRPELIKIFNFRQSKLRELFPPSGVCFAAVRFSSEDAIVEMESDHASAKSYLRAQVVTWEADFCTLYAKGRFP